MTDETPLRIVTAFGPSRDRTLLLATHPDAQHLPNGYPDPARHTWVLTLEGSTARFLEQRPVPLSRSWCSPAGTGYCTSVASDKLYIYSGGSWSEEVFSPYPADFVKHVFGLGGAAPHDDVLFLVEDRVLHVRVEGRWSTVPAPEGAHLMQVHGRSLDQVYVGGGDVLRWNGTAFDEFAGPIDDSVNVCWVTGDDRLLGGDQHLHLSTPDGQWERLSTGAKLFKILAELAGVVYAATYEDGIIQVYPGAATRVTPGWRTTGLVSVGDGLIALGKDRAMVFDGQQWSPIAVPQVAAGARVN